MPAVLESFNVENMKEISRYAFLLTGVPRVREVFVPPDNTRDSFTEFIPQFIEALTKPLTEEEKKSGMYKPEIPPRIAMTGTYTEVQEFFQGSPKGFSSPIAKWTDGLPITPPTEELVARMLTGTSHKPDEVVNPKMGPKELKVTVEKVAINAVMAGCKPEHMPVALAMTELGAWTGFPSSSSMGAFFVVSGPIGKELGMNSGMSFLSPGNPANAALGRFAVLAGINLGGTLIGVNSTGVMGNPLWGLTFAESADSPWEGINVDEGFKKNESVLLKARMYVRLVPPGLNHTTQRKAPGMEDPSAEPLSDLIASLKSWPESWGRVVLVTPDLAKQWAKKYPFATSIQKLQDYLWDRLTKTRGEWGKDWFFYMSSAFAKANPKGSRKLNPDHLAAPDNAPVPMLYSPEHIKIIVAGGEGADWGWGTLSYYEAISIDKWR